MTERIELGRPIPEGFQRGTRITLGWLPGDMNQQLLVITALDNSGVWVRPLRWYERAWDRITSAVRRSASP